MGSRTKQLNQLTRFYDQSYIIIPGQYFHIWFGFKQVIQDIRTLNLPIIIANIKLSK